MEHLIISAIGDNNPQALNELFLLIAKNECNVEESRMTLLGSHIAIIIMITGHWNTIAKVEAALTNLQKNFLLTVQRTPAYKIKEDVFPYLVSIVGLNQSHIVYEAINFFVQQGIIIDDIQTTTYAASLAGTTMLEINLRVGVSATLSIADFREQFAVLCDELNLDGSLEPEKP